MTRIEIFRAGLAAMVVAAASAVAAPALPQDGLRQVSEFSAQQRPRPRIRVQPQPPAWLYPRPDDYSWPAPAPAYRLCEDWYQTEYRPSGTVITPQMRCRWVRG